MYLYDLLIKLCDEGHFQGLTTSTTCFNRNTLKTLLLSPKINIILSEHFHLPPFSL